MAPSFIVSAVSFLFLLSRLMGWNIPYTPVEVQNALTILAVIGQPAFVMFRQWYTGRSTVYGTRPKQA